jgi:hypothetical protein
LRFPKDRRVLFYDYPQTGNIGEYLHGNVRLFKEHLQHDLIKETPKARTSFSGLRKNRFWSPTDALYFFGYAWTTYINVPFILPTLKLLKEFEISDSQERWNGLEVEFPNGFDTHSKVQTFYFDQTGLLRRNDYSAEIIGGWAMGAHYSEGYTEINHIQVALRRRVYVRLGKHTLFPLNALSADLAAV